MKKVLLSCLLIVGCTVEGKLTDDSKNKWMQTTDTRDGEVFYYNTNTIHDIRIGFGAESSYKIVTTKDDTLLFHTNMESWMKTVEVDSLTVNRK